MQQGVLELQAFYIGLAVKRDFVGELQAGEDFGLQGDLLVELQEFRLLIFHSLLPERLNGVILILGGFEGCVVDHIGQERAANLHLYGRVANPIRGSLIGQEGHLDNDGLPFLLFVASHPPQALVDLFGEVNLQHGASAQLFDERIKTSLVKIGRLTGQYRRHSHNTGERGGNRSFDRAGLAGIGKGLLTHRKQEQKLINRTLCRRVRAGDGHKKQ